MKLKILILCLTLVITFSSSVVALERYELVVYGGEPEGVMAAVAAARQGTNTLLVMKRNEPGGLMVYSGLNYLDLNYGPSGNILGNKLFKEWHQLVGGEVSFPPQEAQAAFNFMLLKEENIKVYRSCELISINKEDNILSSLTLKNKNSLIKVEADRFIDASQDADLAVLAGASYFLGGADIGLPERMMAATLVIHIDNINYNGLRKDVYSSKFGPSYINNEHAWGFVRIGELYQPENKQIRLRGLNIVLQGKGAIKEGYINALLIFGVDPFSEESLDRFYNMAEEEAKSVLEFLKNNLGGFADARLLHSPPELYIRETRHIVSLYQLSTSDLLANKIHNDAIALASYPLDYQASSPDYNGFVLFNPELYGIPFRSLIPEGFKNLLVVGRSSGYSSLAAASSRVLPVGMSTGESAGIAAGLSIKYDSYYPEMVNNMKLISDLQNRLGLKKNLLGRENNIINDKELLPYLENLLSWGLVIAGYDNDFRLEEPVREIDFSYMLLKGLQERRAPILFEWVPGSLTTLSSKANLTRDRAAMLLLAATSHRVLEMNKEDYYTAAMAEDLLPDIIRENRQLNRRDVYIIVSYFLQRYPVPENIKKYRGENDG